MSKIDFMDGFSAEPSKDIYARVGCFGDSYTGKTTFLLSFPDPIIFDLDVDGAEFFKRGRAINQLDGKELDWAAKPGEFKTQNFSRPFKVMNKIHQWHKAGFLADNKGAFQTLCIDPMSDLWGMTITQYEDEREARYNKTSAGNFKHATNTMRDWGTIKKPFARTLIELKNAKMHVVLTSHSSAVFVEEKVMKQGREVTEMNKVGSMAKGGKDNSKNLHIEMELLSRRDPKRINFLKSHPGVYTVARIHKDRTDLFIDGELVANPRYQLWAEKFKNLQPITGPVDTINYVSENHTSIDFAIEFCIHNEQLKTICQELQMTKDEAVALIRSFNGSLEHIMTHLKGKLNGNLDV